jgi:hypothetical protein
MFFSERMNSAINVLFVEAYVDRKPLSSAAEAGAGT